MTRTRAWRGAAISLALALILPASAVPAFAGGRATTEAPPARLADTIPALLPSPGEVRFDGHVVGQTGPSRAVTFLNTTPGPLTVATVALIDEDSGTSLDFAVADETCTAGPIAPDTTCTVRTTFTPTATGTRTTALILSDASPAELGRANLWGTGQVVSKVDWGTRYPAGTTRTWSYGSELARTTTSTAAYLHAVYTTDRVGGRNVTDHGPHLGVYYIRSASATGATWSSRVRLNPSTQHGDQAVVSASGASVYAAWVSQTRYLHYDPAAPRALYVRVNGNNGTGSWRAVKRLTSASGRVSSVDIASAGAHVYIAYTNANNGKVRVLISDDRGRTWRGVTLGTTTQGTANGKTATPSIAASGSTVVVAWAANAGKDIKARTSTSSGASWGSTVSIASGAKGAPSTAAALGRLSVAWPSGDGARVRIRSGGTWQPAVTVHPPDNGRAYELPYAVAVALNGSAGVGLAWNACWRGCDVGDATYSTDLVWTESTTNGESWFGTQLVAGASSNLTSRINDAPAIVWPGGGRRTVVWNGWTAATANTRLYVRTAGGAP
jgi:hypothetical protein